MESHIPPNKYQLAGVDDLDRGFNRQAEIRWIEGQCHAIFQYEKFFLESPPQTSEQEALTMLIAQLHERGYTQLRTRLQFRGEEYLGNQEIWEEHRDPQAGNVLLRLFGYIRQFWQNART
ncbi:hypothetical protein [Candidatus Nitronereus thalassa]|uniref:Uncharacterized protein n=1 Tax=Candidatus Nitronereus thalassa TaxID=3020898 RepID=A0ABU3K7L2_9BACT|nr:hypothetical protein [Candidatus Nitronereus thalassa]MDT7042352.1 hypothetical protein [Candidatus Nitronereus thalassa]